MDLQGPGWLFAVCIRLHHPTFKLSYTGILHIHYPTLHWNFIFTLTCTGILDLHYPTLESNINFTLNLRWVYAKTGARFWSMKTFCILCHRQSMIEEWGSWSRWGLFRIAYTEYSHSAILVSLVVQLLNVETVWIFSNWSRHQSF